MSTSKLVGVMNVKLEYIFSKAGVSILSEGTLVAMFSAS
jgi:hypothetical protein